MDKIMQMKTCYILIFLKFIFNWPELKSCICYLWLPHARTWRPKYRRLQQWNLRVLKGTLRDSHCWNVLESLPLLTKPTSQLCWFSELWGFLNASEMYLFIFFLNANITKASNVSPITNCPWEEPSWGSEVLVKCIGSSRIYYISRNNEPKMKCFQVRLLFDLVGNT